MKVIFNNTKLLRIILLVFMALPSCCIAIGSLKLRFALLLLIPYVVFLVLINTKNELQKIAKFLKPLPNKILIILCLWWLITGIISCIFKHNNLINFTYYYFFHAILLCLIPYFLSFNFAQKENPYQLVNYYYNFIVLILIIGLINTIFLYSGIPFLQEFFDRFITNTRNLNSDYMGYCATYNRVTSVFVEPSGFAYFIVFNFPILYEFFKNKININKYFNSKTILIIAWINLILTMSPIYLILGIIITSFYVLYINRKKILQILIIGFTITFTITILGTIYANNPTIVEGTYLERILKTVTCFGNFYDFIVLEHSLATRVINMVNQWIVFLHNPIFGVGYGNILVPLNEQFVHSPLPLTTEILLSKGLMGNYFLFWTLIAETGIFGISLVYCFLFSIIKKAIKTIKAQENYVVYSFLKSSIFSIILFIILSIYAGNLSEASICFLGFITGLTYKKNRRRNGRKLRT